MNHVMVAPLDRWFEFITSDSYALLSTSPTVRKAAIFVHGFGGHPVRTWSLLQDFLTIDPAWRDVDAYFIGYDSVGDETRLSAEYVGHFIREVCPVPPDALFTTRCAEEFVRLRPNETSYDSIELFGHSLGGVVLRIAILELLKKGLAAIGSEEVDGLPEDFRKACEASLKLFAPAQGGARISGLKGMAVRMLGVRAIVDIFKGRSPSMQELEPGSQLLQALREDVTYFAERYPAFRALRARIAWAHHDDIVTSMPFRHDVSYTVLDSDHVSVCKPSPKTMAPFVFATKGVLGRDDGAL